MLIILMKQNVNFHPAKLLTSNNEVVESQFNVEVTNAKRLLKEINLEIKARKQILDSIIRNVE